MNDTLPALRATLTELVALDTTSVRPNAPLIDYQHPHDLFMDLGATWTRPVRTGQAFAELSLVGSPAL